MKYKGFFVKITPDNYLPRETENGEIIAGEGFRIEVFTDESEKVEIDIFSAAVDFELIKNSIDEAEQFAKDYIDCEEKEYRRMLDEFRIWKYYGKYLILLRKNGKLRYERRCYIWGFIWTRII